MWILAIGVAWLGFLSQHAQAADLPQNLVVASASAKRVALVIGNSKYPNAPLRNPANDAKVMAAALRTLGFEVIEKVDVNQKEMNRAISLFGSKLSADSIALFYYSGHGIQARGKNFIVPIDADISSEAEVRSEAVDVDAVLDQIATSQLNIVILDACRNNPFERGFRSVGGGLAQMDAPKGTLIAYATAPGRTAVDGDGANSPYTTELITSLQVPGLSVEQIFKRVRANVAKLTADRQVPWEASSLTGEFYFSGNASAAQQATLATPVLATHAAAARSEADVDDEFWASISSSQSRADFVDYLFKFPAGRHVDAARSIAGGTWVFDPATHCGVWFYSHPPPLAVRWQGDCKDGRATGTGQGTNSYEDKRSLAYEAHVKNGMDDGPCKGEGTRNGAVYFRYDGTCKSYLTGDVTQTFEGHQELFSKPGEGPGDRVFDGKRISRRGETESTGETRYLKQGTSFKGHEDSKSFVGTETLTDGRTLRCTFIRGLASGTGCDQKFPDGTVYKGDFKDGKRSGHGRMEYADKTSYEGEWIDDGKSGSGVDTLKDGAKIVGTWVAGKLDGAVLYIANDGKRTEEKFVAGVRVK